MVNKVQVKHLFIRIGILSLVLACLQVLLIPSKSFCFEPDTYTYLEFNSFRTVGYPLFLKFCALFSSNCKFYSAIQIILSLFSILWLILELTAWIESRKTLYVIWLLFALNPIIYIMNVKILTEGLFSTLAVCIICCSFKVARKCSVQINIGLISFFIGLSITIRPSGYFYLVAILFLVLYFSKREEIIKNISWAYIPASVLLMISSMVFNLYHDSKKSLFPSHIFAKGMMLLEEKDITELPPNLQKQAPSYVKLNQNISNLEGFNLRHLAHTRLEVLYQHHLNHGLSPQERKNIGFKLVRKYKSDYAKMTFLNFLHLWTGFEVFSQREADSLALQNQHWIKPDTVSQNSWTDVLTKKRRAFPLYYLRYLLIIPLIMIIFYSIRSLYLTVKKDNNSVTKLLGFFSICSIGSSLLTALISIATLRYTLILTPFLLIIFILSSLSPVQMIKTD